MSIIGSTVILLVAALGSVLVDVQMHDSNFSKSITGQTLKGYGGYEYGLLAYESFLDGKKWVKDKTPEYAEAFMEWSKPYRRLSHDLGLVVLNATTRTFLKATAYINDQYPVAQYWVQKNLPGMKDASYNAAVTAINSARNNTVLLASYLKNNVFVGSWSPENMKNLTLEAYNSTQEYASNTMSWIYKTLYPPQGKPSRT